MEKKDNKQNKQAMNTPNINGVATSTTTQKLTKSLSYKGFDSLKNLLYIKIKL